MSGNNKTPRFKTEGTDKEGGKGKSRYYKKAMVVEGTPQGSTKIGAVISKEVNLIKRYFTLMIYILVKLKDLTRPIKSYSNI